jgi:predicted secreted protein
VVALWQGAQLLYLGRAASIRSQLEKLAGEWRAQAVTAVSWEKHDDPAAREAELCAEYERGSRSLLQTYGQLQGNMIRTARLVAQAKATIARSATLQNFAQGIRAGLGAAAA